MKKIASIVPSHLTKLNEICKDWVSFIEYQPIEVSCSNPLQLLNQLHNSKRKMVNLSNSILEDVSPKVLLKKVTEWLKYDK